MELTFSCSQCDATGRVDAVERAEVAACACGMSRPLHPEAIENGRLRGCPWCGTTDLYVQKDFPHGLGLAVVVAGFAASTVFWYFYLPVAALGILLGTALLDLVLYYVVPEVTICYRCLGQIRGAGRNPEGRFRPFDLAIGERYRQERLRVAALRERARATESGPAS